MSVEDLKKIVEELKGASKMHASQAERIQKHIDEMNEGLNLREQYKRIGGK